MADRCKIQYPVTAITDGFESASGAATISGAEFVSSTGLVFTHLPPSFSDTSLDIIDAAAGFDFIVPRTGTYSMALYVYNMAEAAGVNVAISGFPAHGGGNLNFYMSTYMSSNPADAPLVAVDFYNENGILRIYEYTYTASEDYQVHSVPFPAAEYGGTLVFSLSTAAACLGDGPVVSIDDLTLEFTAP